MHKMLTLFEIYLDFSFETYIVDFSLHLSFKLTL